ncbi:MAG: tyrosine-type recombinase/integrase, partial [Sporocytophaga sp.]|uniref:tyrosine-type recombinase/integrase n=1 Tax=Sporocytophaga sp. TaxID=2231183 RepID=UPI001B21B63E
SNPNVLHKEISTKTALVNKYLRKIQNECEITGKKLSSHVARHTFATISVKKEIPIKIIADLMGHSTVKTTEGYLHTESKTHDDYMTKLSNSI